MVNRFQSFKQEIELLEEYVKQQASKNEVLHILEAGCGRAWPLNMDGIKFHLTGVDTDTKALEIRKSKSKDLHEIIEGDLREVELEENKFDIVYSSFVLEHIDGAEIVLDKFQKCLKPGGVLILRFPDRDSGFGFVARMTPFWMHVFYKKYLLGNPNAGKPGFDPYPVFYDNVVSQRGFRSFCDKNHLTIKEEWGHRFFARPNTVGRLSDILVKTLYVFSFGKLAYTHDNLTYISQKIA